MGYIYKIENTVDNKIYIGQTIQELESRWKDHRKKGSNCRYLKSAIQKYGIDNFDFQLVCITFDNQLDDMEKEYIEQYDCLVPNGYNLRLGGDSGKHHEDTKRKIAATLLQNRKIIQFDVQGNRLKSFYCLREAAESVGCSPSNIGRCCNGKIRTAAGYVWKYESINSDTAKNQSRIPPLTGKCKGFKKPIIKKEKSIRKFVQVNKIIQFDIEGNRLNTFNSLKEAGEYIGCPTSSISHCCNGNRNTSMGYMWKYEKVIPTDIKSEEEINKKIIARKNQILTQKNMKIVQYDIDGNRLATFDSCKKAAEYIGISRSCITHCCLGDRKTAKGFVWKYESIL